MITARIIYRKNEIIGFEIKGHADFAEMGQDIVCAGVSAISQTAVIGLTETAKIMNVKIEQKKGMLKVELPKVMTDKEREDGRVILETMVAGLKKLKDSYTEYLKDRKYFQIKEAEVR